MRILGYIFFIIVMLCYVGLAIFTSSRSNTSGQNDMGYGLALAFLGFCFALSSLILTVAINVNGGFAWVSQDSTIRTSLVVLAWLMMVLTVFFCAIFMGEWRDKGTYPEFLHWVAVYQGQLWIPLPWLFVCFFSLNPAGQSNLPANTLTSSFWIAVALSGLYSGGLLIGYLRDSAQSATIAAEQRTEDEKRWHQIRLDEITAHKPEDSIFGLLKYTSPYQDDDVKQAALAKIKTHADWEAQLLKLLENKYYFQEVYYFLNGNPVDHPAQFIQPLKQSTEILSERIKADIVDSNNLQSWSFDSYGIENLLQALDGQFRSQRDDFYPSILKVKQALDTTPPERFKGIHFTVSDVVDRWLRTHKK